MNNEHTNSPDLAQDLNCDFIRDKVQNEIYAQHLYAALCNNDFQKIDVFNILRDDIWSTSWRGAGRMVANLRNNFDASAYMDFYCSGISGDDNRNHESMSEGHITNEIANDLKLVGWRRK